MEKVLTRNIATDRSPPDLKAYERAGGYRALKTALKEHSPRQVVDVVKASKLRGRGGAGFQTGMKWGFVPRFAKDDPARPKHTYLVANADEMEPGTFKDRLLMEGDPHQFIESLIVSSYAIDADICYIFLRGEYVECERRLNRAIAEAQEAGYLGEHILDTDYHLEIRLHTSAGRYICGEETALLSALEGQRAIPRTKPPFPAQVGLFGKPTTVNNVETLCNVPHIINNGAEWFKSLGLYKDSGPKLFGASGRVQKPGIWELPLGTPMGELLERHAGGMRPGYGFKTLLPGGASTGFLTPQHWQVPMDFEGVAEAGSRLGTGTMIVVDDQASIVGVLRNLEHFFAQESCGWCTPCRDGLPWVEQILSDIEQGSGTPGDLELLKLHARFLGPGRTFCAHAPGAITPLESALEHFRDEIAGYLNAEPTQPARAAAAGG